MSVGVSCLAIAKSLGVQRQVVLDAFRRLKLAGVIPIEREKPDLLDFEAIRRAVCGIVEPAPRSRVRVTLRVLVPGHVHVSTPANADKPKRGRPLRIAGEFPTPPATRAGCDDMPRPCPALNCRHNLFIDTARRLADEGHPNALAYIRAERGDCCLELAQKGPQTLEEVGRFFGVTRERVRQIEARTLYRLRRRMPASAEVA